MYIDLSSQPLPQIFKRKGRKCYLDPIRKKLIVITPEETVKQRVLSYIINELKVPMEMNSVEDHLSHYGIKSSLRADILIKCFTKDDELIPNAVIECKAPGIGLGEKTANQMLEYSDLLGCDYAMMIDEVLKTVPEEAVAVEIVMAASDAQYAISKIVVIAER